MIYWRNQLLSALEMGAAVAGAKVLRNVVVYATMIYLWLKISVEPKYWSLIVLHSFLQTNYWLFLQFDFFILFSSSNIGPQH